MTVADLQIDPAIRGRLAQGHPWIYRNHVREGQELRSGQWVRVRAGSLVAYGLWDAQSAIAVRLFSSKAVPDRAWFTERVWEAWELRATLRQSGSSSAYRWIYGEGDGIPGVVVDRYGDYAVIQSYAESLKVVIPLIVPALRACDHELRGVLLREYDEHEGEGGLRTRVLWGEAPPEDLVVQEHGLYLQANLSHGQKTGLFLDQRENRRSVEALAGGCSVLNCFAYTGAFSLYALRGGATQVVSVDIGRGLAEAAATNLTLNRLDASRHHFVTEDCFPLLERYSRMGQRFQMIILDPPSFARQKRSMHAALRAYTRLNALALGCIEPGGLLISASCTSQVSPEQFRGMLADAASQREMRLQIIHEAGQPVDHPVPVGFPEGRYLKFVVARALAAL
jgi:23S rRNA (cytosine1962-C5)-methyltransferase